MKAVNQPANNQPTSKATTCGDCDALGVHCQDTHDNTVLISGINDAIEAPSTAKLNLILHLMEQGFDPILPDKAGITPFMIMPSLRDNKQIVQDSALSAQVKSIIQKMKDNIIEQARKNQKTVYIDKSGKVTFISPNAPISKGFIASVNKVKVIPSQKATLSF